MCGCLCAPVLLFILMNLFLFFLPTTSTRLRKNKENGTTYHVNEKVKGNQGSTTHTQLNIKHSISDFHDTRGSPQNALLVLGIFKMHVLCISCGLELQMHFFPFPVARFNNILSFTGFGPVFDDSFLHQDLSAFQAPRDGILVAGTGWPAVAAVSRHEIFIACSGIFQDGLKITRLPSAAAALPSRGCRESWSFSSLLCQ